MLDRIDRSFAYHQAYEKLEMFAERCLKYNATLLGPLWQNRKAEITVRETADKNFEGRIVFRCKRRGVSLRSASDIPPIVVREASPLEAVEALRTALAECVEMAQKEAE